MRFAVVGAGAIGAYVGAALARSGSDVVVIARGAHLAAMQREGITVASPRGDFRADVEATDDIAAIAGADAVILGLKAYSLPELAPMLARHLPSDCPMVAAQNGVPWWYFHGHGGTLEGTYLDSVDPGGVVADAIPPRQAIGCVVYCSTEITQPGVIRHIEGTRLAIGEPDGSRSRRCGAISEALVAAGLKCPVVTDLREQIWLKLVGHVPFNAASALTGATLGQLGETERVRGVLRTSMEECAAVGAELGISLPTSTERRMEAAIAVADHKTSTLQDLEAGKPPELGCLSGAVLELAQKLDVAVPATRTLHACVEMLEHVRKPPVLA